MNLPNRLFFTGVPGSKWSGIAQTLESHHAFNTTDRTPERTYIHSKYSGHVGAYFGEGMEFPADPSTTDLAWNGGTGIKIVKSHDWAYVLDDLKPGYINDWVMLVYRPDLVSYAWWHEAGGFSIKYPDYSTYNNSSNMLSCITAQNKALLDFACKHDATWNYFTNDWVESTFGIRLHSLKTHNDVLVTIVK